MFRKRILISLITFSIVFSGSGALSIKKCKNKCHAFNTNFSYANFSHQSNIATPLLYQPKCHPESEKKAPHTLSCCIEQENRSYSHHKLNLKIDLTSISNNCFIAKITVSK